jgi:nuclear pore complex protein Nup155
MSYEELIVAPSGVAAARALVNIVIDQQIGQQIGVDTVSEILQSRCGSFCSTDDVMLYKVGVVSLSPLSCSLMFL